MIQLDLPYPPSANRLWRAVNGRNIKSAEYRSWLIDAARAVPEHVKGKITGPYRMTLLVDRPDRRRRDLSNLVKPIEDLLQAAGVVRDDCDAQGFGVFWTLDDPREMAGVHVCLQSVDDLKGSLIELPNAESIAR